MTENSSGLLFTKLKKELLFTKVRKLSNWGQLEVRWWTTTYMIKTGKAEVNAVKQSLCDVPVSFLNTMISWFNLS